MFAHSQEVVQQAHASAGDGKRVAGCGDSILAVDVRDKHGNKLIEIITKGRRQGVAVKKQDPYSDVRARCRVSKGHLFAMYLEIVRLLRVEKENVKESIRQEDASCTYLEAKAGAESYTRAKAAFLSASSWEGNGEQVDNFEAQKDDHRPLFFSQIK